jgi:hypothetical protein
MTYPALYIAEGTSLSMKASNAIFRMGYETVKMVYAQQITGAGRFDPLNEKVLRESLIPLADFTGIICLDWEVDFVERMAEYVEAVRITKDVCKRARVGIFGYPQVFFYDSENNDNPVAANRLSVIFMGTTVDIWRAVDVMMPEFYDRLWDSQPGWQHNTDYEHRIIRDFGLYAVKFVGKPVIPWFWPRANGAGPNQYCLLDRYEFIGNVIAAIMGGIDGVALWVDMEDYFLLREAMVDEQWGAIFAAESRGKPTFNARAHIDSYCKHYARLLKQTIRMRNCPRFTGPLT